jgi:hypothetical protein
LLICIIGGVEMAIVGAIVGAGYKPGRQARSLNG